MTFKKILGDPLTHFILAGVVVFIALSSGERATDEQEILITRDTLVEFVQARSRIFDDSFAAGRLEQMSEAELRDLIDQYEREEALYREAMQLGLDKGDYVIRQRLVGKMGFITNREISVADPSTDELQQFFKANLQDYIEPASATFTHVFLSGQYSGEAELELRAQELLASLRADSVPPDAAQSFGDRFLYHSQYIDRDHRFVSTELGRIAADRIFADESPIGRWFGPVYSEHGAHLVNLTMRSSQQIPEFVDVRQQVVGDYARLQRKELQAMLEATIVSGYQVETSPDVEKWLAEKSAQSEQQLVSYTDGSSE